jgi:hypothetical protein
MFRQVSDLPRVHNWSLTHNVERNIGYESPQNIFKSIKIVIWYDIYGMIRYDIYDIYDMIRYDIYDMI